MSELKGGGQLGVSFHPVAQLTISITASSGRSTGGLGVQRERG